MSRARSAAVTAVIVAFPGLQLDGVDTILGDAAYALAVRTSHSPRESAVHRQLAPQPYVTGILFANHAVDCGSTAVSEPFGHSLALRTPALESRMQLVPELFYRVKTTGPLPSTSGSPRGERQYWIVDEAELHGERIRATLAAPGSDWMWVNDDGFWRPDVRAPFRTEDGATVLMHYTGLVEQTARFKAAADANRSTEWDDQYMRLVIRFDTGAPAYRWLNTSLFVARGRLLGRGHIEYEVHRVS